MAEAAWARYEGRCMRLGRAGRTTRRQRAPDEANRPGFAVNVLVIHEELEPFILPRKPYQQYGHGQSMRRRRVESTTGEREDGTHKQLQLQRPFASVELNVISNHSDQLRRMHISLFLRLFPPPSSLSTIVDHSYILLPGSCCLLSRPSVTHLRPVQRRTHGQTQR
jgi:hypothetical protein